MAESWIEGSWFSQAVRDRLNIAARGQHVAAPFARLRDAHAAGCPLLIRSRLLRRWRMRGVVGPCCVLRAMNLAARRRWPPST